MAKIMALLGCVGGFESGVIRQADTGKTAARDRRLKEPRQWGKPLNNALAAMNLFGYYGVSKSPLHARGGRGLSEAKAKTHDLRSAQPSNHTSFIDS